MGVSFCICGWGERSEPRPYIQRLAQRPQSGGRLGGGRHQSGGVGIHTNVSLPKTIVLNFSPGGASHAVLGQRSDAKHYKKYEKQIEINK